jgi:5-methylcytosine-specific restriction endonuclease McrA
MELFFNPQPKNTKHIRIKPKLTVRTKFSPSVRKKIKVRDKGCCQQCGDPHAREIHHVKLVGRKGEGKGVYSNGLLVCNACHRKIHDDPLLLQRWQLRFEQKYGKDYYKDVWD